MKAQLLLCALFVGAASHVCLGQSPVGKAFVEPLVPRDTLLVADQVRFGVMLQNLSEGTPVALPEVSFDPSAPLVQVAPWHVDSTRVSGRKERPARYDLRAWMVLAPFLAGQYDLPELPVVVGNDTLRFPSPSLLVAEPPVDMETFEPHDIQPQIGYPYTFREILPWVLAVCALAVLVTGGILLLRRRRRSKEEAVYQDPPHITALRALDRYRGEQHWAPERQKAFYSGVTDALRAYISARFGVGALEMTTPEVLEALRGEDLPADLQDGMRQLFERADYVKFAKYIATESENASVLPLAVGFVTRTYQTQLETEDPSQRKEA